MSGIKESDKQISSGSENSGNFNENGIEKSEEKLSTDLDETRYDILMASI